MRAMAALSAGHPVGPVTPEGFGFGWVAARGVTAGPCVAAGRRVVAERVGVAGGCFTTCCGARAVGEPLAPVLDVGRGSGRAGVWEATLRGR
jgi:hypothetical protein